MQNQALTVAQAAALTQAHALWQSGAHADAWAQAAGVVRAAPHAAAAQHLAGLIAGSLGDSAAAVAALTRAFSLQPDNAEIGNSLATAHLEAGDWPRAAALFAALAQQHPAHLAVRLNWALGAARNQDSATAFAQLEQAAALEPMDVRIWLQLGDVHQGTGALDKAGQAYQLALQAAPDHPVAHHNLATVYAAQFAAADAQVHFARARRGGMAGPLLDRNEALAMAAQGNFVHATERIARVCQATPDDVDAQLLHADFGWQAGLFAGPCEPLLKALFTRPNDRLLRGATVRRALNARDHAAALAAMDTAPEPEAFRTSRAYLLSETGEPAAAQALYDQTAAANADNPDYWAVYARHLLRQRDPAAAADACHKALAIAPDLQIAQSYLSLAWRLAGDPREAWLHAYDQLVHVAPLGLSAGILQALTSSLTQIHTSRKAPVNQSVRGGTQTMEHLFTRPNSEIAILRECLEAALNGWFAQLPRDEAHPFLRRTPRNTNQFLFSGAWSVQLAASGFHVNHMHSEGWLSSACYIALPPEVSDDATTDGWLQLGAPPVELELDLPPRRLIRPQAGHVVLFPSSMWHGTLPFQSAQPRLSVAFDVVPR